MLQEVEKEKGSLVRAQLTLESVRRDSFASVHLHTHTHTHTPTHPPTPPEITYYNLSLRKPQGASENRIEKYLLPV